MEQWIQLGGIREDATSWVRLVTIRSRFYNHFLDPLQRWDQAGLQLPLLPRFESSVRWAQRTDQDSKAGFGNYSWLDARRYYLTALRGESPTDREQGFADTFRALGQVMHLVVDASVPEHVRADPHPLGAVFGNYEYWVSDQHPDPASAQRFITDFLSAPITPDPALFDIPPPTGEDIAKVRIARLFDSDRYTGANPGVTAGFRIGIAEVANANFLSEDTRHGQYPHPARANMEPYVRFYTKSGLPRRYYKMKLGFGLPVDPVAEECFLNELTGLDELCVDPEVWRETALKMLPRAVGYSQAVLDYFFRGKLDFEIKLDEADPTRLGLIIRNEGTEDMAGEFALYAENGEGRRAPLITVTTPVYPGVQNAPIPFTPPADAKQLILVFQGTLGEEQGAVAGRVKPWEAPYIFARQATAELTATEQLADGCWPVPGGGCVGNERWRDRSKDSRQQRATGTFFVPDKPEPGKYLKRVSVAFEPLAVPAGTVRLRLNGQEVSGLTWDRETSPIQDPTTWELGFDLPQLGYTLYYRLDPDTGVYLPVVVWNLPRFLVVETVAGTTIKTPLVWWGQVSSRGSWNGYIDSECLGPGGECLERVVTSTALSGSVFFGDGDPNGRDTSPNGEPYPLTAAHTAVHFTPTQGVAGFAVGTVEDSGDSSCITVCTAAGSCAWRVARVFAGGSGDALVWNKNAFSVSLGNGATVGREFGTCMPPTMNVPDPPLLPEVRFRRDYLPGEQALFQQLHITPPEYEITLK